MTFPLAVSQFPFFLNGVNIINPVLDPAIAAIDRHLHLTAAWQDSYRALFPLTALAGAAYLTLPLGLVLVTLAQQPARRVRMVVAIVVTAVLGYALYATCPAIGPTDAIAAGLNPQSVAPMDAPPEWRNGMPSLHAAWSLLILSNLDGLSRRSRWALAFFSLLNLWATVGLGQHWVLDLVVAAPLFCAVQIAIVDAHPWRYVAPVVIGCAACIAGWLVLIRSLTPRTSLSDVAVCAAAGATTATLALPWLAGVMARRALRRRDLVPAA